MKKNESEDESVTMDKFQAALNYVLALKDRCNGLEERILALEKALIHAQHTNTDDGSRHKDDGGWFD